MSQPAPVPNDQPSIHDVVSDDLLQHADPTPWRQRVLDELGARKAQGLTTYGTILQAGNGRDALQDAFEEALDLTAYLMQAALEAKAEGDADQRFYSLTLYRSASALCVRIAYAMHRREQRKLGGSA